MCNDSRKHKPLRTSFQRVDDSNPSAAESEEILKFNTASYLAKTILLYILYDGILVMFSFKFDRNKLQIKLKQNPPKFCPKIPTDLPLDQYGRCLSHLSKTVLFWNVLNSCVYCDRSMGSAHVLFCVVSILWSWRPLPLLSRNGNAILTLCNIFFIFSCMAKLIIRHCLASLECDHSWVAPLADPDRSQPNWQMLFVICTSD